MKHIKIWNRYEFERPDYETYVKRIKKREIIDQSIQVEELKKIEWIEPK
jgi:hypothetical protein